VAVSSYTSTSPPLTGNLCALARDQLQMQTSRSGTLDAGALGVMGLGAALAALVINADHSDGLEIAALSLVGLSVGLAVATLRLAGADETGPSIAAIAAARTRHGERVLEEWLLNDLAEDVHTNERGLARKATLFDAAVMMLMLAVIVDLAGRL
jgi:hypothetical protein